MSFIVVYIPNPDKETAKKIMTYLLEKRLAACVNIIHTEGAFRWKEKIEISDEYVILAKTTHKNFEKIKQEIKKIHPYECPEIMKIDAEANEDYENWVKAETK